MILPTEVNYINESKERVKIAFSTGQSSFTLDPGENRRVTGKSTGYDIDSDIIINPEGPNNNTFVTNFLFDNPFVGSPFAFSSYVYYERNDFSVYYQKYVRTSSFYKTTWGKVKGSYYWRTPRWENEEFDPFPIFDLEAFPQDDGAKKWDLHIKKVSGEEFSAAENTLYSMNLTS